MGMTPLSHLKMFGRENRVDRRIILQHKRPVICICQGSYRHKQQQQQEEEQEEHRQWQQRQLHGQQQQSQQQQQERQQ